MEFPDICQPWGPVRQPSGEVEADLVIPVIRSIIDEYNIIFTGNYFLYIYLSKITQPRQKTNNYSHGLLLVYLWLHLQLHEQRILYAKCQCPIRGPTTRL